MTQIMNNRTGMRTALNLPAIESQINIKADDYRALIDALKPFAEILDQVDLRSLPKDTKFSPKMTLEPFLNASGILAKINGDKA